MPAISFGMAWVAFIGVILALSGVEAVANMTGVMPLDQDSTAGKTAREPHGVEGAVRRGDRGGDRHGAAGLGDALAAGEADEPQLLARRTTCCASSADITRSS